MDPPRTISDSELLSDVDDEDLAGLDAEQFLKAPIVELLIRTNKLRVPSSEFRVNLYHAACVQFNKLEHKGFASVDPAECDSLYKKKLQLLVKTGHPYSQQALDALRMMKSGVPIDKRIDASITMMREGGGSDASAYVELNNYCQRLQREGAAEGGSDWAEAGRKKNVQSLATLVAWRSKGMFASGDFDFAATNPVLTVDSAYVEDLVRDPPKAPRKRKIDVRGPHMSAEKRRAAPRDEPDAALEGF